MLWFAFIYCIFAHRQQQYPCLCTKHYCCDLLSFIVSLLIGNSNRYRTTDERLLWFAFIYCIFAHRQQPSNRIHKTRNRCDLLSFIVSLLIGNSWLKYTDSINLLWFAFIYCIFAHRQQLLDFGIWLSSSCDLLSFIVSLLIGNSISFDPERDNSVVICFHLLYLCS